MSDQPRGRTQLRTFDGVADEEIEWDIDANLPLYTRDYLRLLKPENADEFLANRSKHQGDD